MWIRSLRPDRVKREGSQGQCPKKKKNSRKSGISKEKEEGFRKCISCKSFKY